MNGAQSVVKTMDVLWDLTAAVTVVILGNHLETAIQHFFVHWKLSNPRTLLWEV